MNKVFNKAIAAALAGVMTISLAACGSSSSSDTSSSVVASASSPSTAAASSSVASGEKVKLDLWHIQNTEPAPTIIKDSMSRFMKDNPNYDVTTTLIQNDAFKEKLKIAMSSKTMPDIFPHWTGGNMNTYADEGTIADLTSFMNENNYKDRFMDAAIGQATYKDKIWAIPVENTSVAMVIYNKDMFAKH